jgi:hypothetical protein
MMFKGPIECYEAIGATLAKSVPEEWLDIKAEIALDGTRVDAVVSYTRASGTDVGYLTGVPMLARYFHELANLVSSEEKGLFKRCLFTLQRSGKYDAQFTY